MVWTNRASPNWTMTTNSLVIRISGRTAAPVLVECTGQRRDWNLCLVSAGVVLLELQPENLVECASVSNFLFLTNLLLVERDSRRTSRARVVAAERGRRCGVRRRSGRQGGNTDVRTKSQSDRFVRKSHTNANVGTRCKANGFVLHTQLDPTLETKHQKKFFCFFFSAGYAVSYFVANTVIPRSLGQRAEHSVQL